MERLWNPVVQHVNEPYKLSWIVKHPEHFVTHSEV